MFPKYQPSKKGLVENNNGVVFSKFSVLYRMVLGRGVFIFLISLFSIVENVNGQKANIKIFGDSTKVFAPGAKVTLTGTVVSLLDRTPASGTALFVDGFKYGNSSDANGKYYISLPPGKYRLSVRHLGMEPIQIRIAIYANAVLNFEMGDKPEALEEVIIKARKEDENISAPQAGVTMLNITEIKRLPAFMGEVDVIKSLQLLPGVNAVGEGSGGFNVRGGRIDQNLILMDGAQIFNSAHALGLLSNFNPDVVEDFALYKGNVPAQFGGRASSVLDVRTRNGNFEKIKVKGGIGLVSSRLTVEGPIVKNKTSFIVGARSSYSDWMLKSVDNTDVRKSSASFYDINANITHKFSPLNSLSLSYYRGNDFFRYSDQFGYDYTTQLFNLKWKAIISDSWSSAFTAVSGDYQSNLYDYTIASARSLSNGIGYYQLKQNFLYTNKEKHAINFGADANLYNGKPEISKPYGEGSMTKGQRVEKDRGREFGFYANEEYTISPIFSIAAGLRYSLYQYLGPDTVYSYQPGAVRSVSTITDTSFFAKNQVIKTYGGFEPRISAKISLSDQSSIKVSYNRMRQYIHLISNSSAPTPIDIWQVSNLYIKPQIADNYSIGYFKNAKDNMFELSAEVFYKTTANLVEYKDFAQLLLNRHLETELLQGKGKAYGIEFFAKKNLGAWTGWISYTYLRSFIKVDGSHPEEQVNQGNWYPTNYDKPNTINVTANRKLGKNARFATNFTYSTGRPTSALVSNYSGGSIAIPVYSDRNQYRIPDYWRVDVSITINNVFNKIEDNLTFSVYNLFARRNAYSVFYQQPPGTLVPQGYKLSILGSALPSITYNFSF